MNGPYLTALVNHLWQSTLFVAVIGCLTLILRRNSARWRYCLWLSASVKFLVPFSLLMAVGARIPWPLGRVQGMPIFPTAELATQISELAWPGAAALPSVTQTVSYGGIVLSVFWMAGMLAVIFRCTALWNARRT